MTLIVSGKKVPPASPGGLKAHGLGESPGRKLTGGKSLAALPGGGIFFRLPVLVAALAIVNGAGVNCL